MALLDSFYGETPAYLSGLLGSDELRRLQEQAQGQSNLGMAAALLKAGAPSRTPTGGALAIAEGLQAGQQLYKSALNQGLQEKMAAMQLAEQTRKLQESQRMRELFPQIFKMQGTPDQVVQVAPEQLTMYGQPTQGVVRDDEGNLMPGGAVIPAQMKTIPGNRSMTVDTNKLQALAAQSSDPLSTYASLAKLVPDLRKAGFIGGGQQENPFDIFANDTTVPPALRAVATQLQKSYASGLIDQETADKRVAELGNRIQSAQDRAVAQAGVEAARQGTAATNAILAETRKEALEAKRAEREKPVTEAKESLQLINQAEKLLDTATGSLTGTGVDILAGAVGKSTAGAQDAAKLKAIQGALVAKMPKMSGPQSDKDVLLYREMAAQVGDSTIPADTRKAALQTLREIQERYAKVPEGSSKPVEPTSPFKFDAAKENRYQQWLKQQQGR